MNDRYWGKIILFGEYSMIFDSTALLIPLKRFSARWASRGNGNDSFRAYSGKELMRFCDYLKGSGDFDDALDIPALEKDIRDGWYLDSDIPVGYGLGSSGTVVAGVYDRYAKKRIRDPMDLKDLFSRMEDYFHGSSSGIDPLLSFLGRPFRITPGGIEMLDEDFIGDGIRDMTDTSVQG